jgi:hypothetical protein
MLAQNPVPALVTNRRPLSGPRLVTVQQRLTFYGWPDNDPPGNAIAYPHSRFPSAVHDNAGGTGTYLAGC